MIVHALFVNIEIPGENMKSYIMAAIYSVYRLHDKGLCQLSVV